MTLGGFQNGFTAKKIARQEAKFPQFLICSHNCKEIIQLISNISKEVEFELCEKEARKLGDLLIDACKRKEEQNDT